MASEPSDEFLDAFFGRILDQHGIRAVVEAPSGLEVTVREHNRGELLFVLNHNAHAVTLTLPGAMRDLLRDQRIGGQIEVAGRDVYVLERTS